MIDQEIADRIDAAVDRWQRAVKVVRSGKYIMPADREDVQTRLMDLDALITRYDFSGREVVDAAVQRAHKAMCRAGEVV